MLLNISIDDVTPNPASSTSCLKLCQRVIKHYPTIKFSLFISTAYWRTLPPEESMSPRPYCIWEYPSFCDELKTLDPNNFELCYHGVLHGIPNKSNNDEFRYLDYEGAMALFSTMKYHAEDRCHLPMKQVFRPPAWRMSADAIRAARDSGFTTLALSDDDYALETYGDGLSKKKNDVVFYTSAPPIKELKLSEKIEIVYHALKHDTNVLNDERTDELCDFLEKNESRFQFSFIEDLRQ